MHKCFISYSHSDTQIALAIQNALEQNNIPCWIDYRDAAPGMDYAGSIVRAIKEASIFIFILSQNSCRSIHVLNEINSAVNAGSTMLTFKIDDSELSDSLEYYLGRTHWINAQTAPMEDHLAKLVSTVSSHKDVRPATASSPTFTSVADKPATPAASCRMMKYQDLLSLGYTSTTIALQLVENDYINYNGIGMENEGTAQQWEEYLQDNSETFQYLVNENNQIIGDWSIVALTEEVFQQAKQGELLEADIDIDKTTMICFPGIYYGYILTLSILPSYRNMKNHNLLVESFLAQLEEYAENGIFFKSWCMNVFSKDVESLVRQLGFKYLSDNKVFGKIYGCEFMPPPNLPIYKKHAALLERYRNAET